MTGSAHAVDELLEFLSAPNSAVRIGALELLQGLTGSPEGLTQLVHRGDAVIPPLLRLLGVRNPAGALAALTSGQRLDRESPTAATCLVNLTSHTDLAEAALVRGVVERLMECVRNAECEAELRGLCVMVLANATVTEKGTLRLLQEGKGPLEGFHLEYLLRLLSGDVDGRLAYLAHVAANASATPLGRRLLLKDGTHALVLLKRVQEGEASEPARKGSAIALRNCLMDAEHCPRLLADCGAKLVPALLQPLGVVGRGDEELRCACADALSSLAATPEGRAALWAAGAPKLLQRAYESEDSEAVNHALERGAALLVTEGREEPQDNEVRAT